jgi:hypothetical protein
MGDFEAENFQTQKTRYQSGLLNFHALFVTPSGFKPETF